ncbi:MAG: hypothetical protein OM95_06140 [Bdellovibrio sp. ArHS]|uniref:hypothetical protein n=1 Tax=Bdellovibrio sp. ArHS TaxID=1569284 RepID=UPI000583BA1C|nr:hypothetical protein [Bdellovibrio sp. ArHS]KHD89031.1 MAG: hypothetical protein OM95_06140 [Bdellovibrio sp. ArHS]
MENEINELRKLLREADELRVKKLILPDEKPARLLGVNGTIYLLRILDRFRDLLIACISAYEHKRVLSLYIEVRAHFETTASLMYFYGKLCEFYDNAIDLNQMEEATNRISSGSKLKPDWNSELPVLDPVNVLTTIKHADRILREAGSTVDMFAGSYNFISELAHPNHFGLIYKSEVSIEEGTITFLTDEDAFQKHSKGAIYKLLISVNVFMQWYQHAFSLLKKNETMPLLVR